MRNRILRVGAFLAILILLIAAGSLLFRPKNNNYRGGMENLSANSILAEPENTIDVVFLGDSETYCAFIPLRIWQSTGITSYVSSVVDQKFYETPEYLYRAFENQNPGMVLLETNVLYQSGTITDRIANYAERTVPLLRYHDRWKRMRAYDWYTVIPRYEDVEPNKGYYYRLEQEPADTEEYMEYTEEAEGILPRNLRILESMNDFCRNRGAQLVLVSSPSTQNWDMYRHNAMVEISQELEIPYLDMNCLPQEVPIDWELDTMDGGDHMNYFGAAKVSDYMAEYLAATGLFSDKRTLPEYAQWNTLLNQFIRQLKTDGIE